MYSYVGETAQYRSGNGCESAATLVSWSSTQDEGTLEYNTYANTGDVAPGDYEVPVSGNQCQCEAVVEHKSVAETDDATQGFYEVPVSGNQSQYETVVEPRTGRLVTENPNVVYEGVGYRTTSTASSLFYQYVPSKVSTSYNQKSTAT